jgi:hypothetical protein
MLGEPDMQPASAAPPSARTRKYGSAKSLTKATNMSAQEPFQWPAANSPEIPPKLQYYPIPDAQTVHSYSGKSIFIMYSK